MTTTRKIWPIQYRCLVYFVDDLVVDEGQITCFFALLCSQQLLANAGSTPGQYRRRCHSINPAFFMRLASGAVCCHLRSLLYLDLWPEDRGPWLLAPGCGLGPRQTTVTNYFSREQLLLPALALQCGTLHLQTRRCLSGRTHLETTGNVMQPHRATISYKEQNSV